MLKSVSFMVGGSDLLSELMSCRLDGLPYFLKALKSPIACSPSSTLFWTDNPKTNSPREAWRLLTLDSHPCPWSKTSQVLYFCRQYTCRGRSYGLYELPLELMCPSVSSLQFRFLLLYGILSGRGFQVSPALRHLVRARFSGFSCFTASCQGVVFFLLNGRGKMLETRRADAS